jgi:hypothetical protein
MFGPIQDRIGRSLIVLFLVKPLIDLGYFLSFWVGRIRLAPTTVAGLLICIYFAAFRFKGSRFTPPFIRVFEAFLVINLVSILLGLVLSDNPSLNAVLVLVLKILNSYVIFFAAYTAATTYQYEDVTPFVRAIVIGSSVAVISNLVAIGTGFGGSKAGPAEYSHLRETGLYYDAGVLANHAFFDLVFAIFWLHLQRRKTVLWLLFIGFLVVTDLYLIAASKSRSVMIELAVFSVIYVWLFHKRFGKILAPLCGAAVVAIAVLIFDIDTEELFVRFEGDVAALQSDEGAGTVSTTGEVSLGQFEGLGSNRGALWAGALTEIAHRPAHEILFGDFFSTSIAHSDYIDVLGRNGVIGLVLYLVLLAGLLRNVFLATRRKLPDRERIVHIAAFILLVCYVLYSLPFRPLSYTTSAWYMWLMLAFSLAGTTNMQIRQALARRDSLRTQAPAIPDAHGLGHATATPRQRAE